MGIFLGTIVRLILAAIIVGVPAFLMGGTLPAAVRAVIPSDDSERRSIGIVYGANTLGAVTGVALGTFYCFEHFGNRATLWLAATVNVVVALIALFSAKAIPDLPATRRRKEVQGKIGAATNPAFILGAAALVGCAFFLMEMVWYRMLSPLLGGSTFSFGMILAVALLGIGLGGAAYALFGLKRSASLQVLALTCGAEAFFIALPYALGDRLSLDFGGAISADDRAPRQRADVRRITNRRGLCLEYDRCAGRITRRRLWIDSAVIGAGRLEICGAPPRRARGSCDISGLAHPTGLARRSPSARHSSASVVDADGYRSNGILAPQRDRCQPAHAPSRFAESTARSSAGSSTPNDLGEGRARERRCARQTG